jgi:predicted phage-related endonuclease
VLGPDDAENERMRWGTLLEPVVRAEAARRLAVEVVQPQQIVAAEPWMRANVDGLIGTDAVLECKTAGSGDGWGEPGTDDIPEPYLAQCAWYLAVTARSLAHVAVLIGGNDFRMYQVARNPDLEAAVLGRCRAFWFEHVLPQVPPDPITLADASKRWRCETKGKAIPVTTELAQLLAMRRDLKATEKATKEQLARVDFALQTAMQDAEAIVGPDGWPLLTWKYQRRDAYTVEPTEMRVMRVNDKNLTKLLENPT